MYTDSMPRVKDTLESNAFEIIESYTAGASIDDLSKRYGCSNTPIRHFLIRHGVPFHPAVRPPVLSNHTTEIVAMYQSGKSTSEIAKVYAANRDTVSLLLKNQGIRRRTGISQRTIFIPTDADRGMLAGLLLGEGSVIVTESRASVRIVNTDPAIIEYMAQFGGRVYWNKRRGSTLKPLGIWDVSGAVDVFYLLTSLLPLLVGVKKQRAENAIRLMQENYGLKH